MAAINRQNDSEGGGDVRRYKLHTVRITRGGEEGSTYITTR